MNNLTQEEKDIVLDFYFRCGDEERITKGRDLIASDPRAAELYASLESTLCQMDQIKYEPCPDNLVDITVARLALAAAAQQVHAEVNQEEAIDLKPSLEKVYANKRWWGNISDFAAVAAVLLAVLSFAFPSLDKMRQFAWQKRCQSNQQNVAAGMSGFINDYGSLNPGAAADPQRKSSWKNTYPWEMVKEGRLDAKHFVCPGRKDGKVIGIPKSEMGKYNDFPSRNNMNYSLVIQCPIRSKKPLSANDALMVDRNPVFEGFDLGNGQPGKLTINQRLMEIMSANHSGRGQNLLLGDGSVIFLRDRMFNDDDIYTVKGTLYYDGYQVPREASDIFLAP